MKKDERFKKVLNDPRYKTFKPVAQNVELDKRFEQVLSQKRFAVDDDLFHKAESSSSDESSSDEEEEIDVDSLDEWEEEDKKCYRDDVEETNRIAVCNLDWDRINSNDIYVLLHSFKSADGQIESVTVYPSEFGKQRMAEELIKGPKELAELPEEEATDERRKKVIGSKKLDLDEDEEINRNGFVKHKLRKYQINRLRYYYAVVEFDSVKTAVSVYEQLEGFEYLNSSVQLDLRFIPNGMQFDEEPTNRCTALPDLNFYKAPEFINTALQQTKGKSKHFKCSFKLIIRIGLNRSKHFAHTLIARSLHSSIDLGGDQPRHVQEADEGVRGYREEQGGRLSGRVLGVGHGERGGLAGRRL